MLGTNEKITIENIFEIEKYYIEKYKKLFKKLNVDVYEILYNCGDTSINNYYKIEVTTNTYEKLGRKCFPKKPTTSTTETFTAISFLNCLTGIIFFGDRVHMGYTPIGYTVTRTTFINPTNTTKIERIYRIVSNR